MLSSVVKSDSWDLAFAGLCELSLPIKGRGSNHKLFNCRCQPLKTASSVGDNSRRSMSGFRVGDHPAHRFFADGGLLEKVSEGRRPDASNGNLESAQA